MRTNSVGNLQATVHNTTGKKLENVRLAIKTAKGEKIYDVDVPVENNHAQTFWVTLGESTDIESFAVLRQINPAKGLQSK